MQDPQLPELTKIELEVMKSLWTDGRLSAREIHQRAGERQSWSYSTTRTVIERMVGKGLLAKEKFHGIYLYTAMISRPQGLARWVRHFADRVLEIDYQPVVSLFTQGQTLSAEEIDELQRLLDEESAGEPS